MQNEEKKALEAIGNRLKFLRTEKKYSLRELSAISGVDFTYIGKIEEGAKNPTALTLLKLAAALDADCSELLRFANPFTQL